VNIQLKESKNMIVWLNKFKLKERK